MKYVKNGKIIMPDGEIEGKVLAFSDVVMGVVDENEIGCFGEGEVVDACGGIVSPGLVDIHIHGYFGEDSSDGSKEGILKISKELIKNGVGKRVVGIKDGIEKFSKVMMPLLFFIVVAIAIYSMTLPGASAGLDYLFNPDFSKITGKAFAAALGQAFFSLSLGFGTIMTYASYVSKKENIMFQSAATAVSDLMFAMIAGMAIMPAVFAFGLNPQSGPGLVFETLPFVFGQMPAGGVVAILFFLALLVAALTSSISMLEVAVAYLVEEKKFSRLWACVVLFALCWVVGAICSLSFGPLSDIKIDGGNIFDFFDNLSSNILMTLGSLLTVLFVGWRLKKTDVYDEFTNGGTLSRNARIFGVLWFLIRYVCPLAIAAIFISGLL